MFGLSRKDTEAKAARILDRIAFVCAKEFPHLGAPAADQAKRDEFQVKKIQLLYRHLDILDAKTSVLLRFDGLMVTAFIFLIGFNPRDFMGSALTSLTTQVGLLLAFVSAALCLSIARITSKYLEYSDNLDDELRKLASVAARRALHYRIAWFLSCLALGLVALALWSTFFK